MIDISVIVLYIIGIFVFGIYKAKEVKNIEDYLVAGRRVPLLHLVGTLVMTEFNTATLIGVNFHFSRYSTITFSPFFFFSPFFKYKIAFE